MVKLNQIRHTDKAVSMGSAHPDYLFRFGFTDLKIKTDGTGSSFMRTYEPGDSPNM
jgi:hypothetical protein